MQFLVYIAVVLLSLGGILVELDWLTKPKLETKSPVQVASTAVPARTVPKVDGPTEGPSPVVSTKKPEAEQANAAPAEAAKAEIPSANQSAGTAPAVTPAPFPAAEAEADAPPQTTSQLAAQAPAQAPVQPPAQTTGQAPASATVAAADPQPLQAAAKQAPNSCDVQGCASAYQSFRASDCTYQPMEGPRKFCEKPPGQRIATTPQNLHRPSRDAELRDVERAVRSIRVGDETGYHSQMGRSEVIVIERPGRDW